MSSNRKLIARPVAGLFFPQLEALGFDSRECTPELVRVAMSLAAEVRSFERAAKCLKQMLGHRLSAKSIERLVQQVGTELRQQQESEQHSKEVVVPAVAVTETSPTNLFEQSRKVQCVWTADAPRSDAAKAKQQVFIGDGLSWNWSIQQEYFPKFTPILDFIHAVQYLYSAAQAWESDDAQCWSRYLELTEAVWQGRVNDVVQQLRAELASRGVLPEEKLPDDSPHQPLVDAARYWHNNHARMDCPRYRRAGLPITSSPMESLLKQINLRVKGTEMFGNEPAGAEAILQLRSASLSEDGRLDEYLRARPGSPFVRRPPLETAA